MEMELMPDGNNENEYKFDVAIENNMNNIIKTRDTYLYLESDELNNEDIIKDKLASEVGYGGEGAYYIYLHIPELKIGDQIPSDIEPVHTITIAVSSLKSEVFTSAVNDTSDWIPVAAPGQQTTLPLQSGNVTLTISEEALSNHLDSWKNGYVNVNHAVNGEIDRFKILDAKYEDGLLYHQFAPETAEFIRNQASSGRSIELNPIKIIDNIVVELNGLGLSVLYPPHNPTCTPEMGCSSSLHEAETATQNHIKTVFLKLANKLKSHSLGSNPIEGPNGSGDVVVSHSENPNTEELNMDENIEKLTSEVVAISKIRDEALTELKTLKSSLVEKDADILEKDSTIQANSELLKEQTDLLKSFQDAEIAAAEKVKEDQWNILQSNIPAGMKHKEEDAAALKQEFLDDAAAFSVKLMSWQKEGARGESGAEFPEAGDGNGATTGATTGVYTPGKGYEVVK